MILEWILLIPITGFQQRPLLWFSVNSYTLNFEKGFGKLLKSCTKRYPRDQSSFPRKLCCWPLRGKSYETPVFSDLPQIEAGLQTDKIQKGSSPCEVLRADLFPGKTLWPLHPPHQLRPRCGTRNRNSAEKFQHSTTQNFPILACFLPQKGTPASLGPGLWSF